MCSIIQYDLRCLDSQRRDYKFKRTETTLFITCSFYRITYKNSSYIWLTQPKGFHPYGILYNPYRLVLTTSRIPFSHGSLIKDEFLLPLVSAQLHSLSCLASS